MTPRRALFDPLQTLDKPSWLLIRNMTGAVLDTEEIPAGADLKRVFMATMLEWIDAGWQVGEFSSTAGPVFLHTRQWAAHGRDSAEPGQVDYNGVSGRQGCTTCGE